ncbi:MAG: hypothetical protein IJN42_04540 [Clostridia bacterium]|nr:hypothetical protein [Clostridia bacterium]
MIGLSNQILLSKKYNRYYFMEQAFAQEEESFPVLVFGSCHSYTSFHAPYFEEKTNLSAYDLGNPGEVIPATYLRMKEQFKKDAPQVALLDIWGLNAYETYTSSEEIFESYLPVNVELIPYSLAKAEVIRDFSSLDQVLDNFAIAKYKDRLMNQELFSLDFEYSFDSFFKNTSAYSREEMKMRMENNGFCVMPMWQSDPKNYTPYMDVSDYETKQATVSKGETLAYEADIVKYLEKIIVLCEEYDVELILYRAPYISKENELKKSNWLKNYCKDRDLLYIDLEEEISFDVQTDFLDYHHLNESGAKKATEYLTPYILEAINE